ncbi:hypothetical protein FHU41_002638 [Psychromicrobium silvestre]|uniref:Uncharacterized protein n=1 Tax=Psychromicrobium silvestre TaxID=1645614 RepID=A0A7Y9LVI5_9MICC|nr:hypothetical protein [Psychromicrobium silvestre]
MDAPPFDQYGAESFDICPCCGVEYGNYDFVLKVEDQPARHEELRKEWIANGTTWWSKSRHAPQGWSPQEQLKNLQYVNENVLPWIYQYPFDTDAD